MAPSSSDMLGQELSNGAMDFQSTTFGSEAHPQASSHHQDHFAESLRQQRTPPQQLSGHTRPQSQTDHPFSQLFQPDAPQPQHQQQHHPDPQYPFPSQNPPFSQPQPSGNSYQAHHTFSTSSQEQSQSTKSEHQYPVHAQQNTSTGMANTQPNIQPPVRSSTSPQQAQHTQQPSPHPEPTLDPQFDIFEWYPKYQSCQRYFVDHAQISAHVQAVAAFINIALPLQRASNPVPPAPPRSPPSLANPPQLSPHQQPTSVSLIPYLRRLVVTGLDFPGVLHGFFGDDWVAGVGPLHEQERRNYLFAAKSGGWASVKKDYDMSPLETVPFMRPLQGPVIVEIEAAEKSWSEWLAMEDWMVGPRAPEAHRQGAEGHEREGMRR